MLHPSARDQNAAPPPKPSKTHHPYMPILPTNSKGNQRRQPLLGALQLPKTFEAHDITWQAHMPTHNINGYRGTNHRWRMSTATRGHDCFENCNKQDPHSCFWYFSHTFPNRHLNIIKELTNRELQKDGQPRTSKEEIIHFFGVILLIPRLPNMPQKDLWREKPKTRYGVAADLNRTRMNRHRFEKLLSCIR